MSERKITLAHGSGGQLTHELIKHLFVRQFANPHLSRLTDAAVLSLPDTRVAMTTDSYVIRPLAFPGGNIGTLAVCGAETCVAETSQVLKICEVCIMRGARRETGNTSRGRDMRGRFFALQAESVRSISAADGRPAERD